MQSRRSIGQYRAIDLFLFGVMMVVFETVAVKAAMNWFPREAWMVSMVPAVTAVVMVRWGSWCAVHAVLGGIVTVLAKGGTWQEYLIYGIGNPAVLAVLPLVRKQGWEKLHKGILPVLGFSILSVLAMQAGRAVPALMLGVSPAGVWRMAAMDSITCLFTAVIVWITSRLDGMLEDQAHYLKRLSHEPEL